MRLTFLYDSPCPAPIAAWIQILNTARHAADLGVEVAVGTGPLRAASDEAALAAFGLMPHHALRLVPFFDQRERLTVRLRRYLAAWRDAPHAVVVRGESGIEVLNAWPAEDAGALPLLEAHRLAFGRAYERQTDRPWTPGARLGWRVRRVKAREAAAVRRAAGLVCLTEPVRVALHEAFGDLPPSTLLPSGVDAPDEATAHRGYEHRDLDLVFAGKLAPAKGADLALEALAHLPTQSLDVFGGEGEEVAALRRLAETRGVGGRVRFHGRVDPPVVRDALHRAKVALCPLAPGRSAVSDRFSSPMKLLQAMACGAIVVASDVEPVRAIANDGVTAHLAPAGDPAALAAAVLRALDDAARSDAMRAAALEAVRQYTWRHRAQRLLDFATELSR